MADFTDLLFKPHPNLPDATQAKFGFPNGYGISVITGTNAYTHREQPYEVAIVLHGDLCYDTPITDDVLGYQTAEDVSKILAQVEALPDH